MCLIAFDWQPGARLVLTANRDEFFQRPSAPLSAWEDQPLIIAGRDLQQGGTWLGVSRDYRVAALTNVRAPGIGPAQPRSRGHLVSQYLSQPASPADYARTLQQHAQEFAPFNLLLGDQQQLWYLSNYPHWRCEPLPAGLYGLSNAARNTPWPKTRLARQQLQQWLQQPTDALSLARLLNRREPFADHELPATGVPLEWERWLSAQFIQAPGYGTRCSTGLWLDKRGIGMAEISWDETGQAAAEHSLQL